MRLFWILGNMVEHFRLRLQVSRQPKDDILDALSRKWCRR